MGKVIIGIHGLNNKPPQELLEKWWKEALCEGFRLHKYKSKKFKFDLVYWADLNYETPQDPNNWDHNNPEYLSSTPYIPHEETDFNKIKNQLKEGIRKTIETGLDFIFLRDGELSGLDKIVDIAMGKKFSDLHVYYTSDCAARPGVNAKKEFRQRLTEKLKKYKRHQIMLIAHSMGSIIAYDTLMEIGKKYKVDYLVTIGSPLGWPVIIKKTFLELKEKRANDKISSDNEPRDDKHEDQEIILPTPEAIGKKWYNIADIDDKIALICNLEKKFAPSTKNIRPLDIAVKNNYIYDGKSYPHKIYGYLRSRELSQITYEFITSKPAWLQKLIDFFIRKPKG
ncbi:MAG: hypothetical protein FWC36_03610 [Spirochaetes bacterium]|nr:hypothetical protein [Spirochaetota bacterium]